METELVYHQKLMMVDITLEQIQPLQFLLELLLLKAVVVEVVTVEVTIASNPDLLVNIMLPNKADLVEVVHGTK